MRSTNVNSLLLGALVAVSSLTMSSAVLADSADTVFLGGKIYTVNSQAPWAEAVAVKDGEIVYVGDEGGLTSFIGPETDRLDLGGQMLLPGFIDTHVHPVLAAASMNFLSFDVEDDLKAIYKKLKAYAKENPEQDFIVGHGFSPAMFDQDPTSEMLDEIIADRTVLLIDTGGHLGWANSKAMEAAGVNASTPDPIPGSHYYVRDKHGKPTGYMYEESTFEPFLMLSKGNVSGEVQRNAAELFPLMSSFGITSVFDASMEWFLHEGLEAMKILEGEAELPFRMVASMTVDRELTNDEIIEKFRGLQRAYHGDHLSVGVIKIGLDGTIEGKSAALLNTYKHGGSGALNWEPEVYKKRFVALDKGGIDIHIHAIGDRAVNLALDAIEAAREANGYHGTRHTVCHTEVVQSSDIPRFKALDVIAQTTPVWHAYYSDEDSHMLSDTDKENLFPFRSISETGARVTFGSDFPYGGGLEALLPAYNLEIGHTRQWPGNSDIEPLPRVSEKLPLETLIRGYTLDAAYQLRMEDKIGSIEVGKRADLIVLGENLFDLPAEDLHNLKVEMTMVDGKVVYERPFYQWLIEWWLEI